MKEQLPPVDSLDPIGLAGSRARGKRPYFFRDADVERVLSITMAIATELAVLRQRMDTMEELLAEQGTLTKADVDAFVPNAEQAEARGRWNQEYLARILRILQQEREAISRPDEASSESVGEELAKN